MPTHERSREVSRMPIRLEPVNISIDCCKRNDEAAIDTSQGRTCCATGKGSLRDDNRRMGSGEQTLRVATFARVKRTTADFVGQLVPS